MKNLILLLLILLPATLFAQWNIVYNHADNSNAFSVLNTDTVVAATDGSGRFHRTTDGGQSWSHFQSIFLASWFLDTDFPTQTVGYACGGTAFGQYANCIAKTTDAGLTWDSLTANAFIGQSFHRINFVDANTGFVSGENGLFLHTTDGGANFSTLSTPDAGIITAMQFHSQQLGLIATTKAVAIGMVRYAIHRTTDLGATWTTVYTDTMAGTNGLIHRTVNQFAYGDASTVYAVGGSGLFLKSVDAGQTWASTNLQPGTNLTSVTFTDANTGYINNAGGIYKTLDGGQNWAVQNINLLAIIDQISMADPMIGYALGNGNVYKTVNGGQVTTLPDPMEQPGIAISPNPSLDYFSVRVHSGKIRSVQVYNATGQLVKSVRKDFEKIDVSNFPGGMYTVTVSLRNATYTKKLIKVTP